MLEWIEMSSGVTVVASSTRALLHNPQAFGSDPFREPMRGAGSPQTSHWLLEGAISAAQRSFRLEGTRGANEPKPVPRGPLTPSLWAYRLANYYHSTHATRRLLPLVERCFARAGRRLLAQWAEQKVADELGHDELALRDLTALGFNARQLVSAVTPARSGAWVALFERIAADPDPVGCVGYAHALERLALLRGAAQVDAIQSALPAGVNATRCLRVHSALGSDTEHVRANVNVTAALNPAERRTIVRTCHDTARIFFDPALELRSSEAEIRARLAAFRARPNSLNNQEQANE